MTPQTFSLLQKTFPALRAIPGLGLRHAPGRRLAPSPPSDDPR